MESLTAPKKSKNICMTLNYKFNRFIGNCYLLVRCCTQIDINLCALALEALGKETVKVEKPNNFNSEISIFLFCIF